jgi:hypothetical protein
MTKENFYDRKINLKKISKLNRPFLLSSINNLSLKWEPIKRLGQRGKWDNFKWIRKSILNGT